MMIITFHGETKNGVQIVTKSGICTREFPITESHRVKKYRTHSIGDTLALARSSSRSPCSWTGWIKSTQSVATRLFARTAFVTWGFLGNWLSRKSKDGSKANWTRNIFLRNGTATLGEASSEKGINNEQMVTQSDSQY